MKAHTMVLVTGMLDLSLGLKDKISGLKAQGLGLAAQDPGLATDGPGFAMSGLVPCGGLVNSTGQLLTLLEPSPLETV